MPLWPDQAEPQRPGTRAEPVTRTLVPGEAPDDLGMSVAPEVIQTVPWPAPTRTPGSPATTPESGGVGKYELIEEIGRGGMGVVYKARHKDLDRIVALKMILASHLASAEQVARFQAEARAAARLQHPHIVAIHDVGEDQGQHYFAMEYVAGPSLATRLRDGPLPPREAARLVAAVARAVAHLHAQGVVHRDLKPSNILLDTDGRPRVTDFGLAKMLQAEGPTTTTGAIVGTPGYMSPEQAAGRGGDVGPLSDVYSLGSILYELLTGRPPFDHATPLDTLVQVLEVDPPRPSQLNAKVPRALELICLKCLEKSPDRRYHSATALSNDLDRFLQGDVVEARRIGPWQWLSRWAKREPALASRLSILAICGSTIQADQFLLNRFQAPLDRRLIVVLLLGMGASVIFQALLRRQRWETLARFAWAAADMILFTTLVVMSDGLTTPLVAGYFLLVAASGLWFRERLVWFTTALAVMSYGLLVPVMLRTAAWNAPHRHGLFLAVLAVSGLIVAYQVKKVRALSYYYEHRPLP